MKQWKEELIDSFVAECETSRAVKFHEVARQNGYNHVPTGDMRDIVVKLKKMEASGELPAGYTLATNGPVGHKNSLFMSLMLVDESTGLLS